jgi:hypothetical protein
MITDIDPEYMSVPAAGMALGLSSAKVYRLLQVRALEGRCDLGKWAVKRSSVEAFAVTHGQPQSANIGAA